MRDSAVADRELAKADARHKWMSFAEKAAKRAPIYYGTAVNGGLLLAPISDGAKALGDDHARMSEDELLLDDAEPFDSLITRCAQIGERVNQAGRLNNI